MGELRRVRQRSAAGFTLVEVMVSLGVIMFGAMAITTLQRHGIRSSSFTRKQAIALEIADRWAARFKQDAQSWTQAGQESGAPSAKTVLLNTIWLEAAADTPNVFQPIVVDPASMVSPAFDFYGNDVLNLTPATQFTFCAAYRPSWVYFGRTMRIDIRVWWRREDDQTTGRPIHQQFRMCSAGIADMDPGGAQVANYHSIQMPVIISMVSGS